MKTAEELRLESYKEFCPAQYAIMLREHKKNKPVKALLVNERAHKLYDEHLQGKLSYARLLEMLKTA